jgi:hypothetical protein
MLITFKHVWYYILPTQVSTLSQLAPSIPQMLTIKHKYGTHIYMPYYYNIFYHLLVQHGMIHTEWCLQGSQYISTSWWYSMFYCRLSQCNGFSCSPCPGSAGLSAKGVLGPRIVLIVPHSSLLCLNHDVSSTPFPHCVVLPPKMCPCVCHAGHESVRDLLSEWHSAIYYMPPPQKATHPTLHSFTL